MAEKEGTAQSNGFIVVADSPDVCKSPAAPIPYPIVAFLGQSTLCGTKTNFQTFPVFHMGSRVTLSLNDAPGVGLGVVSGAVGGWCRPVAPVSSVFCEGKGAVHRHLDTLYHMNCLGPEAPGNTIGKVIYLGAMLCGPVAPGGKPGSQQNPPLEAEKPEELGPLDKIAKSLKVENIQDAVGLMEQAYKLSQVDWSNPAAALGALAGMAKRGGFGDLSKVLGAGKKAIDTDWSDPVKALQSAASIGGDMVKVGKSVGELLKSDPAEAKQQRQSTIPPQPDFLQQLKNGTAGTVPPSGEGPMCKPGDAIVVGTAGTSSGKPGTQDGHVKKLVRDYDTDDVNKFFQDGPNNIFPIGPIASEMQNLEDAAYNHIKARLAERPDLPVDIHGHSRGGYTPLQLAERLKADGIQVRNLGLYDPVDMSAPYGKQDNAPSNVQNLIVVRADGSRELFNRPEATPVDPSKTNYASYTSSGSHAAIGGNPGTAPFSDSLGQYSGIDAEQNEVIESRKSDEFVRQNAQNGGAVIKPRDDYDTHSQNPDLVRMSQVPKE